MPLSVRALTTAALVLVVAPPLAALIQARAELVLPRILALLLAMGAVRALATAATMGAQAAARRAT